LIIPRSLATGTNVLYVADVEEKEMVFPVKYRKALLDEGVVKTIQEKTTAIRERYEIEFERPGMDRDHILYTLRFPSELFTRENGPDTQKHCCKRNFQAATISQISIVNTKA